MPVILCVRVSTPHPQRYPRPKPTLTRRRGYHHPDYRRLLHRSPCAEHGACTPASGSLTGGYGRGGRSVCRLASAPRPSSADRRQEIGHGSFAWAAEGGGLPRQRALDAGVLTPHQPHTHPLSGRVQPGDHRLLADGMHRHSRPLRPLTEALIRRFPHRLGAKPPHKDTSVNPVRLRNDARREPRGHRRPDPDGLEAGIRRVHLDRPTLERWRQGAPPSEFTAGVGVSPAPLARHATSPWRGLEAVDPPQTPRRWLHPPGGDMPPGQPLTSRHGRMAAKVRAHRLERTYRRRLALGRGGGGTAGTPRPSSADRRRRPATTRAPGCWQEEIL